MPDAPRRIQRRRTRGWKLPLNAKCVTRPGRFGNHYVVINGNRGSASELYLHWLLSPAGAAIRAAARAELRGRDLACFCPLPKAGEVDLCHAVHLLAVANSEEQG